MRKMLIFPEQKPALHTKTGIFSQTRLIFSAYAVYYVNMIGM